MKSKRVYLPKFEVKSIVKEIPSNQGWGIQSLNVPETWKVTKGEGTVVFVLDTGMPDHFNLTGSIDTKKSKNFLRKEVDISDTDGHSTHCCGIIGAKNIGQGVVGVAPECKIVIGKVLGSDGSGTNKELAAALNYAKTLKPDVISMSLGSDYEDKEIKKLVKELYDLNIPIIAAAGNDGKGNSIDYPAAYSEVISIVAYDEQGNPASFNSRGKNVDFSAPGVDIYSTWLNQKYAFLSGTSMATPFVAGVVALLLSKHKKQEKETGYNDCRTVEQIKQHLIKYADDKGIVGKDNQWGYGVINPAKMIQDSPKVQPVKDYKDSSSSNIFTKSITFIIKFFKTLLPFKKNLDK